MTKVTNFYFPKVDSLRVRVPLCDVKIIDRTLIDKLVTVLEDTGEVVDEKQGAPKILETKSGLYFKLWTRSGNGRFGKEEDLSDKRELYFLINAKHLKERYFEGITMDNIELIRQELNSLNIVHIEKNEFLYSEIQDVDLCFDFDCDETEFRKIIKRYQEMAIASKRDSAKGFGSKNNIGLELNSRNYSSQKKPHSKFYFKTAELESKSLSFADRYLKGIDFNNIGRFEFNLKNRRYFKYYGIDGIRTLKDLLNTESLHNVFKEVYHNWFVHRGYKPVSDNNDWRLMYLEITQQHSTAEQRELWNYLFQEGCTSNKQKRNGLDKIYSMQQKVKKKEAISGSDTQKKLDKFFGARSRTDDVRTKVPAAGTLGGNIGKDSKLEF